MKKLLMAGLVSAVVVGGQIDSVEAACANQGGFFVGGTIGASFTKVKVKQDGSFLTKDAQELLKLLRAALDKVGSLVTEATTLQTDAQKKVDDEKSGLDTAKSAVTTAESAFSTAKTAYGKTVDVAAGLLARAFIAPVLTIDPAVIDPTTINANRGAAGAAAATAVDNAIDALSYNFFGADLTAVPLKQLPSVLSEVVVDVSKRLCEINKTAYVDLSNTEIGEIMLKLVADALSAVNGGTERDYTGFGAAIDTTDPNTYTPDGGGVPDNGPQQVVAHVNEALPYLQGVFVEVLKSKLIGYDANGNSRTIQPDGSAIITGADGKETTVQFLSFSEDGARVVTLDKTGAISTLGPLQKAADISGYADLYKAVTACSTAYKDVVSNKEKVATAEKSLAEANAALQKTNYAVENQSKVLEAAVKKADDEKGRLAALTTKTVDETIKEIEAEAVSEYGLTNGKASKSGAGFLYGVSFGGGTSFGDFGVGVVAGAEGNTFKRKFPGSDFKNQASMWFGGEFSVVCTPTIKVYFLPGVVARKYSLNSTGTTELSVNANSVINRAKPLKEAVDAAYATAEATSKTKEAAAKATNATDAVKLEAENAKATLTNLNAIKVLTDPLGAAVDKVKAANAEIQKKHNKTKTSVFFETGVLHFLSPAVALGVSLRYSPRVVVFKATQTGNQKLSTSSTEVRLYARYFF